MDPQQTPPPQYPGGYPPQTPAPTPGAQPPIPQGQPPYPQPVQPQPVQQSSYQAPPQTLRPAPQPASWYTPAPKPNANKPADVSSYLQSAGVDPNRPQPQTPHVPGQMVNGQYSIDYLDQMAAPAKPAVDKRFLFVGIGAAIALILAAILLFSNQKTTSTVNETKLYGTIVDIEASTNRSARLIKNSKLSAINGNMRTTMANAARDMETPLTNMGLDPVKLKSDARNGSMNDKKFDTALEDARLNSTYDRIYANEVNTKMKYMIAYMESIKKNNKRKSIQEFITKNEPSFQTIQKSIEEFQNSPEANLY
jgi:hypothetical protein